MFYSILDRKPQKIILGRLRIKNPNNPDEMKFPNNPHIIDQETIKHFQTNTTSPHIKRYQSIHDLPDDWKPFKRQKTR